MLLSNSSVKWSSADSVEWSFLFPLCRWCMTLFESRKLVNCDWASLSHTLDKIGSSDIGLVFAGSSLSSDLRIGTVSAFFHGSGKVLKVKELLIRLVIMGAITGELSFRILALTLSQPGAIFEGRLLIILCTSPVVMGWNANKGVLFGQELRSDSHGSNPSVSSMLKLCSSASFVAFKAVIIPTFSINLNSTRSRHPRFQMKANL